MDWQLLKMRFRSMNYEYDAQWDAWLNHALDSPTWGEVDRHHAELNGKKIWVENYPYGYATPDFGPKVRPSRRTILRFRRSLNGHFFGNLK